MQFINTRPADRAQALTECLVRSGIQVVDLPLLELKAFPYTEKLQQLYAQLLETQIIVVVSPTAVNIGMQYLQQSGVLQSQLDHIQWIAVGQTTAQSLEIYGIQSLIPAVESSEGMLSLPIFQDLPHLKKIAFWRGEGGRQFMMQHCLDHHIEVLNFLLYERYCPESTEAKFSQLVATFSKNPQIYWMCVSSEASWKNWLSLCREHPCLLQSCHYLVLGERLYQVLQHDKNNAQYHFKLSKILNLQPNTVLEKIAELQREL
ncbi:uroporphyrinogen-III synthase [Acinetobacter sp. ANC 4648]|uniref:uroporphyrinogen-III synthase n=1 Tax=Acinetobacter sp. ANC 4648 TaxID=1977875 RepID=UPI000A345CF6|nr:uroporphyrinogen-III synthase [Acinetobacter sp. ANC 4648]OTG81122.1 uroporphyrinogen-III synthase [Acinetobacter sp. ANC 4648]